MDAELKDLLDSYRSGLKTYFDSLPADNAEVLNAQQLLREMESLAEKSRDYSAFMTEAQEKNYFSEIIGFHSKLGNELYSLKPKSTKIPTPSEIAKGYHLAFDSMGDSKNDPNVRNVYDRVFALEREASSGPEFITRMEEENLFLEMSKSHLIHVMRDGLTKLLMSGMPESSTAEKVLGVVSSPQMEHYFESMQKKMQESKSVIEMEMMAFAEAENSRFSNLWDTTFLFAAFQSILSPLVSFRMTGSDEHKEDTRQAYEFVCDFYGTNWEDLFKNHRIWDFFERTIYGGGIDSFRSQNIPSAKALQADLRSHLAKCVKTVDGPIDEKKQMVNFRGSRVSLAQVHLAFAKTS